MILATNNKSETIGTSAAVISEAKLTGYSERTRLIITNSSTGGQNITISVGNEATSGAGILLYPGGAVSWEKDTLPIPQSRVFAISSAAGGTLAIYEEVQNRGA